MFELMKMYTDRAHRKENVMKILNDPTYPNSVNPYLTENRLRQGIKLPDEHGGVYSLRSNEDITLVPSHVVAVHTGIKLQLNLGQVCLISGTRHLPARHLMFAAGTEIIGPNEKEENEPELRISLISFGRPVMVNRGEEIARAVIIPLETSEKGD